MLQMRRNIPNYLKKIDEIDPKLKVYLESEISKGYLPELQKQIAQLEIERELQLSIISNDRVRQKAKEEYDRKNFQLAGIVG